MTPSIPFSLYPFVLAQTSFDLCESKFHSNIWSKTLQIFRVLDRVITKTARGISLWIECSNGTEQCFRFSISFLIVEYECVCTSYEYVMNSFWFFLTIWYHRGWISQLSKQTSMLNSDDSCTIVWDLWSRETNLTMIYLLTSFIRIACCE